MPVAPELPTLELTLQDGRELTCRYIGNPELLKLPLQPLICSRKTPADKILPTLEQVWHWRDTGQAVISGFHSPLEKECLKALLRGNSPIVICPARSIEKLRIPREWRGHPGLRTAAASPSSRRRKGGRKSRQE